MDRVEFFSKKAKSGLFEVYSRMCIGYTRCAPQREVRSFLDLKHCSGSAQCLEIFKNGKVRPFWKISKKKQK